jgi:hypothetical protein
VSAAAGLISGFHAAIAFMRHEQHWLINDADAKAYGQAFSNALRHLPIVMAQKYFDFTALGLAIATYDFPRIMLSAQQSRAGQGASQRGPAQVFQFRQPSPAAPSEPAPSGVPPPPAGGLDPSAIEVTDAPNVGP